MKLKIPWWVKYRTYRCQWIRAEKLADDEGIRHIIGAVWWRLSRIMGSANNSMPFVTLSGSQISLYNNLVLSIRNINLLFVDIIFLKYQKVKENLQKERVAFCYETR